MSSLFFTLIIGLLFLITPFAHAGWSDPFYLPEDLTKSICYKALLSIPFSQIENLTDENVTVNIVYNLTIETPNGFSKTYVSPKTIIPPHAIQIFSPDEISPFSKKYNIFYATFDILHNNVSVYNWAEVPVKHVNELADRRVSNDFFFMKKIEKKDLKPIGTGF